MNQLHHNFTPAVYRAAELAIYRGNPLIEALPPILDVNQAVESLAHPVSYDPEERKLPAHVRQHCLNTLQLFFQPLGRHIELEAKFSRAIRAGYTGRNPTEHGFFSALTRKRELLRTNLEGVTTTPNTAQSSLSFSLVGASGVGKTSALQRTLSLYPQVIVHQEYKHQPFSHIQVTIFAWNVRSMVRSKGW